MLGGSFWIAFLRGAIAAGLLMTVFLLLDRPRFPMKKTRIYYIFFGCLIVVSYSIWYMLDREGYVRFSGISVIPVTGSFCMWMSREKVYLSFYKIALGFYLLAITTVCGIDGSRLWFEGSVWADIMIRMIITFVILFVIVRKIRGNFLEDVDILEEEMNIFSVVTLMLSISMAAFIALWPGDRSLSADRIARMVSLLGMAGLIQYIMIRMYLHRGRERRYQEEKKLLEMNEELLYDQLKQMRESGKEAVRIRHDIRHHCLLIEEYIKNGENEKLLAYVRQYEDDVERGRAERICANETINSILTVYGRYAKKEKIRITMDVKAAEEIAVRTIDMVAVLANVVENAIHGCIRSERIEKEIGLSIVQKGNKIVIRCKNTCGGKVEFQDGIPVSPSGRGIGISSIRKVVSDYNGEMHFSMADGMFLVRILMHLPSAV